MGLMVSKMLDLLLLKRGLNIVKSLKQHNFLPQIPHTLKYLKLDLLHLMRVFKTLKSLQIRHSSSQMPYTLKSFK